jgi:hypothetical protein
VDGKGGGLALYWREDLNVNLVSFGKNHIDVRVIQPNSQTWRCTFVYGEPKVQDRPQMWSLLKSIKTNMKEPWLMVGDFNEAMWQHEHFSATRRNEQQMENFRNTLSFCNLHDLGFSDLPWTYNNKQKGRKNVRVRLDRAVACPDWSNKFLNTMVNHLISSRSDHCPILVDIKKVMDRPKNTRMNRYEMIWERDTALQEEINTAWTAHANAECLQNIHHKLNSTMTCLTKWSSLKFGSVNREIDKIKKNLERLQRQNFNGFSEEVDALNKRLDELLLREEIMWKQRSRITWLKLGDQNTRFFHRKATWRAKKNKIQSLKNQND